MGLLPAQKRLRAPPPAVRQLLLLRIRNSLAFGAEIQEVDADGARPVGGRRGGAAAGRPPRYSAAAHKNESVAGHSL